MKRKCIYCNETADLSESDIIPDALTNARILNKNVCRIAHNNRFSDLFESKVISKLAFITNELDIKSHKGKHYATYDATVKIEGESYNVSLQNDKSVFDGRVLKSSDKKHMISSYDKMLEIAKDENLIQYIDVNQLKVEKNVRINTEIYFDTSMFRMIAKIAYEWYCAKNGVYGYHSEFEKIVTYITTGEGNCPVSIIQNNEIYQILSEQVNLGSHTLFAFESKHGQIEVVVSLFGILMYRIIIADCRPEFCQKNLLFVELKTDSSRKEITHESISVAENYFKECLNPNKFMEVETFAGLKLMLPKEIEQTIDIHFYPFVFNMIKCFDEIRTDTQTPNETINLILINQIKNITQASLLHKKSIKRFVNDYFYAGHKPIKINPVTSNKKTIVLFYAVFLVGASNIENLDDSKFQNILKEKFILNDDNEVIITDELETQFKNKMLEVSNYSDILERGAKIIKKWN